MAKLLVYQGADVVREVALERDPFMIGRALESDLAVMDHLVSRKHAKIVRDASGGWKVVDLGSSNGIYVNEERVIERVLQPADRLRIGSAVFEYRAGGGPPPPPPPPRHPDAETARAGPRTLSIQLGPAAVDDQAVAVARPVSALRADYTSVSGTPASGLVALFRDRRTPGAAGPLGVALPGRVTPPPFKEHKEGLHFFILFQLAQAVNSATSLEELFDRSIDMLCEALDAGCGAILTIERPSGELRQRASRDRRRGSRGGAAGGPAADTIQLSRTIVDRVIQERVAILTRDAQMDERFREGKSVAAMQIRSAICVPIWDQAEVEGIIYLDSSHAAGVFSEDDRDLVTAVGHQLAVAMKREEMTARLKAEAVVRSNLERYHSPDVVDMIIRQEGEVMLDVKEADVTVLFADIEGFTKLSEHMAPAEVARLLNGYFDATTAAIFRHRGQVNKYIGDAILAVFGAPIPNGEHAVDACHAALEMQAALREFRKGLPDRDQFRLRIGLNSGPVVAGNIGAARRIEYTVIGNTVNIASRLEKVAPPDGIALGPDTEARVRGKFAMTSIGPVRLKGIEKDLEVFWLTGAQSL